MEISLIDLSRTSSLVYFLALSFFPDLIEFSLADISTSLDFAGFLGSFSLDLEADF